MMSPNLHTELYEQKTNANYISVRWISIFTFIVWFSGLAVANAANTIPAKDSVLSKQKTFERSFSWKYVDRSMKTVDCNLSLSLSEEEVLAAIMYMEFVGDLSPDDLGLDISLYDSKPDVFQWQLWGAIFRRLYKQAYDKFDPIVESMKSIFEEKNLSPQNRILFVQTFVQNLEYKRPGGTFDLLPPMVALDRQFGDCDTKALLLYILYEKLGIDCVLLWSYKYHHTMLGLSGGKVGKYKTYNGKRFYFLETTYPGWDIGEIPPKTKREAYWHVLDLDVSVQNLTER